MKGSVDPRPTSSKRYRGTKQEVRSFYVKLAVVNITRCITLHTTSEGHTQVLPGPRETGVPKG